MILPDRIIFSSNAIQNLFIKNRDRNCLKVKNCKWQTRKTPICPFWPYSSLLVFMFIDWLTQKSLSTDHWYPKPDSVAQVNYFLCKKWVICIFCANSFTMFTLGGMSLLIFHHVKEMGCLLTVFMSSDVIVLSIIIYILWG